MNNSYRSINRKSLAGGSTSGKMLVARSGRGPGALSADGYVNTNTFIFSWTSTKEYGVHCSRPHWVARWGCSVTGVSMIYPRRIEGGC